MFVNDFGGVNQHWNTPLWGTTYGNQIPGFINWNLPYNVCGIGGNVPFHGLQNPMLGQYIPQTPQALNATFGTFGHGMLPTINGFNTIPYANTVPQGGFYNGTIPQGVNPFYGNLAGPFVGCR